MREMIRRALALSCIFLAGLPCIWPAGEALAAAQTLYMATVRSGGFGGGQGSLAGNLYTVNLANGSASLVGAIRLPGGKPVGVTGLAASPKDGTLYGITSEQSPNNPRALVTIDPVTATATLVGDLGVAGSDIAFNDKGTLYVWLPATAQLGTINLSNATVTPIGKAGASGSPAGIAVDPQGMVFVTAKGAGGTLDNVDLTSGALQIGPPLTGAPFSTQINSMSFSPSGLLLAINSNGGSPSNARLVTINTATGAVATIGALPDDADALTFVGQGYGFAPTFTNLNPGLRVVVVVLSVVLVGLAIFVLFRRSRK